MTDPLAGIAEIDFDRGARRGYPEAIFCSAKTAQQVGLIAQRHKDWYAESGSDKATLFTRCNPDHFSAILEVLPDAVVDQTARLAAWPPAPPTPTGEKVLVVCAGTSDLPVAREALLTARYLGRDTDLVVDVGVAGLDRILNRRDQLNSAGVVVVCAGMEGALASVVAGLVRCPVVAVPTSVGYGAAFEGLAALLSMLNACAPGVGVVNIDNGYGAGHLAAQIAAPRGN